MRQRIARSTAVVLAALLAVSVVAGGCDISTVSGLLDRGTVATASPLPDPEPNAAGRVLWSNDHETGDLSGWSDDGGGGEFNSGAGDAQASTELAHSGDWAAKLSIGRTGSTRLFRWAESRDTDQAYYSAWFYFPRRYHADANWWNIFQFKSKSSTRNDPFWVVNVDNRPGGSMYLYLYDWINGRRYGQSTTDLPVGRWVHLEAYLDQSADDTGRLTIWQDGQQLWDLAGISTRYRDGDNQWSVNNYADSISPSPAAIYVDDATISTARLGAATGQDR